MAEKDMKEFHMNKSCNKINAEPKVERKKVVDTIRAVHPPRTQSPDREKTASAAARRVEEEEEKKKARREKDERQKEAARRAEEEKIEAMKRRAAEGAEALEKKEAIKAAEAKLHAAAAAEERAAKAAETGLVAHHRPLGTPFKNDIQDWENVSMSNETQLSEESEKEGAAFVLHSKIKRHKEEVRRREDEELAAKKRAAADAAEALDRKEAIKAAEAKSNAAAAAEERAAKGRAVKAPVAEVGAAKAAATDGKHALLISSQIEGQEKEVIDVISENHILKAGTENVISDRIHDYIREEKPLNLIVPIKGENQVREISGQQASTEIAENKISRNMMHSHAHEKEPVITADNQEDLQNIKGVYEEAHHANQSGVRPKGRISEPLIPAANSQVGQNENTCFRQEEEPVSVIRNKASQSGDSRGQKEIVSVTGHEKYTVKESEESLRYEGEKSDIHYAELVGKRKMKNSEVEENKQEHRQGYQNAHTSGNKSPKDPIHQGGYSCKGQQYCTPPKQRNGGFHRSYQLYTPPAQRNEGFQHTHQQPHHREQQNHNPNHDKWRERHYNYASYNYHPHAQQTSQFHGPGRALMCGSCGEKFNLQKKLPRNLSCGHSICSHCISMQMNHDSYVSCPSCSKQTWHVKSVDQCPVNQPLFSILSVENMQDDVTKGNQEKKGPHLPEGRDRRQYQSQPGSDKMAKTDNWHVGNKSLPPSSPHGSKCMEIGVRPSYYCCTCKVWVCTRCAEAEHSTRSCFVKCLKDQLTAMKERSDHEGKRAQELLVKSLHSLENSLDEDKIFLIWMRAAFERVEKKQECMKKELEEGRILMNKLSDALKSVPSATNLPEALAVFQGMEDAASAAQKWTSSAELSATGGDQDTTACLRHLMKRTLRALHIENGTSEMFAVDKLPNGELYSELRFDGGRFHLHALRKSRHTNQGVRALPLECFKTNQAAASSLVFLDLSWGGVDRGRLYIRLTGDTLRGRQFISLCIGEGGFSFQGTCFHRVWWKGLPGEHVWTGDYEKGDGSGGRSLLSLNNHEEVPAGRKVPISAGLVAGRYEKETISSIFRIYTREEKGGKDEAGFGQVEFGLDVVKEAVRLRDVTDVTISDCGLVLEM